MPCKRADGKPCNGRFPIETLHKILEEGDETTRCLVCGTKQNITELLFGFEEIDLREQLRAIQAKLDGLDSRIANYIFAVMQAIASESKEGPRLAIIRPIDADWKKIAFANRYRIHFWCEAEGCQHPVFEKGKGVYELDANKEWVTRVAPYANFAAGVLKTLLPMATPAVNVLFGAKTIENWGVDDEINLASEASSKLLPTLTPTESPHLQSGVLTDRERSGVLALHAILRQLDSNNEKLGLHRVPTYTGDYLWLCEEHYRKAQSKIPDVIK